MRRSKQDKQENPVALQQVVLFNYAKRQMILICILLALKVSIMIFLHLT